MQSKLDSPGGIPKAVFGILGAGVLLASVPWLGMPAFYESFLYLICHWMILALSWNILSGYSGYFSFGHGAYFGIGMYTSAGLSANLNWPFLWTLPFAAALAALLFDTVSNSPMSNVSIRRPSPPQPYI